MMKKGLLVSLLLVCLFACQTKTINGTDKAQLNIIPRPNSIELSADTVDISAGLQLEMASLPDSIAKPLADYISTTPVKVSPDGLKTVFKLNETAVSDNLSEAYTLVVEKKQITIESSAHAGLFYGFQSLRQLMEASSKLPCLTIEDNPQFAYRGLHLDVSRHFLPMDFLKKQIDMMARLKLNYFHWHLTDGPGWRLEIKQYPELTEIAAWRPHKLWKDWWASERHYGGEYGGFYTQEEARELVKYAAERHITIIPEIEMPGHSEEVLAVYPHLSCTGKSYTSSEFCIGNDDTFTFIENVLTEVMAIFPSPYIHIGGDEASKEHWEVCPKCQARIKAEGLANEAELQSYMIRRVEKFLHAHNRILIGWDEILEGGLDKSAVVMAWRGLDIGMKAAKDGHNVILTPGEFCYFDSYQGMPDTQPEAIGGFLPIEKVYSFLKSDTLDAIHPNIKGVQANLWAEYIISPEHMEYMIYPRLLALSEVGWTSPDNRNWQDFKVKVNQWIPRLQAEGYNTYTLSKEPFVSLLNDSIRKAIVVDLSSERYPIDIRYTLDNSNPTMATALYEQPIEITDSAIVNAQLYANGQAVGKVVSHRVDYHHGVGKQVIYNTPFSRYYPASGNNALIDGLPGGLSHGDGKWQGFMLPLIDIVVDLGEVMPVRQIKNRFLQNGNAWIWFPKEIQYLYSQDGETFVPLHNQSTATDKDAAGTLFEVYAWQGETEARYVKLIANSNGTKGGWLFLDEIVVW